MADKRATVPVIMNGKEHEVPRGQHLDEFFRNIFGSDHKRYIAAIVNNRLYGLAYPLRARVTVKPVTVQDRFGHGVYRRSAGLILMEAFRRLQDKGVIPAEAHLVVGQSLGDGYFYTVPEFETGLHKETISALEEEMRRVVAEDLPFEIMSYHVDEVREMLRQAGQHDKLGLLRTHWEPQVRIVRCGGTFDLFHEPFAPSTSYITKFRLDPYWPGMLLRLPARGAPDVQGPTPQMKKLFQTYMETRRWNEMVGVENLGQLNSAVLKGQVREIVQISEGLHEKKIAQIADMIAQRRPEVKLVLIAGPSASGKTTFSKRLAVQLMVNGIRPVTVSVDDFFVDRELTPRDENGNYDFESIEAIDLALFNEVLVSLMDGKETLIPRFDFKLGRKRPKDEWRAMRLSEDQVIIVEGIHGLNDRLTSDINAVRKFKIYVSALTQLCIDDHNRIYTSDTRLIRRIVRDRNFRGYTAAETIKRWPSVRRGELRNIFPFQESADVMFNSALVYEPGALKTVAERALLEVDPDDEAFVEAYRLLRFLRLVMPITKQLVPPNSILREFIGQSIFKY